jgi:hypothetical protein
MQGEGTGTMIRVVLTDGRICLFNHYENLRIASAETMEAVRDNYRKWLRDRHCLDCKSPCYGKELLAGELEWFFATHHAWLFVGGSMRDPANWGRIRDVYVCADQPVGCGVVGGPSDNYLEDLAARFGAAAGGQFGEFERLILKRAMAACGMVEYPAVSGDPNGERTAADMVCGVCGRQYAAHPMDWRVIGYGDVPFLNVLCDGQRVKL